MQLNIESLQEAISGRSAAFRCITSYQPAGGPGDKIFPPTYEGGKYAFEQRVDASSGEVKECVLLDSVQSQANRMELALLEAHRAGQVQIPMLITHFDDSRLQKRFSVSSLEAPHRVADALFRDSLLDGTRFRKTKQGKVLDNADIRSAAGLFGLCPTALIFGMWDSTGPRGGLGARFQRTLVSEIIGYDAIRGIRTSSRNDPAAIERRAGPVFRTPEGDWTVSEDEALRKDGKPVLFKQSRKKDVTYSQGSAGEVPDAGRPSVINHGNVTPDFDYAKRQNTVIWDKSVNEKGEEVNVRRRVRGGVTISKAIQTTVVSLSALRRLQFPLDDEVSAKAEVNLAARTVLAALALAAGSLAREDLDLRSRCQLFAEGESMWELLEHPSHEPRRFELNADASLALLNKAIGLAKQVGLPWGEEIELSPSPNLIELVRRSQELTITPHQESD